MSAIEALKWYRPNGWLFFEVVVDHMTILRAQTHKQSLMSTALSSWQITQPTLTDVQNSAGETDTYIFELGLALIVWPVGEWCEGSGGGDGG